MLDPKALKAEEDRIKQDVSQLDPLSRKKFHTFCAENLKDPDTYAALAWSLPVGLHHFYLGNKKRAFLDIGLCFAGVFCLFISNLPLLGLLVIMGVVMTEFRALFRSQVIVQNYNVRLMKYAKSKIIKYS
jgi:TM2 domain-containing membrane protein YozV